MYLSLNLILGTHPFDFRSSAVTPKEMRLYYATKLGRKIDRKELLQARGTVGGADSGLDLSTLSFEENSISWEKFHTVTKNFLHNQQVSRASR